MMQDILTFIEAGLHRVGSNPVPISVDPKITKVTIPKQYDGVTSSAVYTLTASSDIRYKTKVMWSPEGSLVSLNASEGYLQAGESVDITLTVTSPNGIFNNNTFNYNVGVFAEGYDGKYPIILFTQVVERTGWVSTINNKQ
jgi:hypothetical protein